LTRFYKVRGKNLQKEREADHHAKIFLVIEKREIIHQERDLLKEAGDMKGVTLQEGVLMKAISDMIDQGHQKSTLVIGGDKDPPRDPTKEIQGLHQEGIKGTILAADLDHLQESRKNQLEKFIHISKSAKKYSMKMNVKSSGMAFNGSLKLRPRSKMKSTNKSKEMSLQSTLKEWPNLRQ
jgi:hypothetical protein